MDKSDKFTNYCIPLTIPKPILSMRLLCLFFFYCFSTNLLAQNGCACENCPGDILDETIVHEFQANIFNVQNDDLSDANQCVSRVNVKFQHDFLGDVVMELESPDGDIVELIGPVAFDGNGNTGVTFDVSFVPLSENANPGSDLDKRWSNTQTNWVTNGTQGGSYYPSNGNLEDFDSGKVNGTWTLRVFDYNEEGNDEGVLLDFSLEFCDSTGLVCDPCSDPEDSPICTFMVNAPDKIVVPDENFCVDIYAKNVAFIRDLDFRLSWDAAIIQYTGVQEFKLPTLDESDFTASGNALTLDFEYTQDDFGAVVSDSTAIFQVCFKAGSNVGDSTLLNFSPPIAIDVDGVTMNAAAMPGSVKIAVDSTADCVGAVQLCNNDPISVEKTSHPGFNEKEGADCWSLKDENHSKWYKFNILQSGTLEFLIKPKGNAGYRYALYKGNCPENNNVSTESCEDALPNNDRAIGVADNPQSSFGEADLTGFQASISALAGEQYYLLIDNFDANGIGFDLKFAGTALIGDASLQANIADPEIINCKQATIRLDATASSQGMQYEYNWTRLDSGQINTTVGILEPLVLKGGNFNLEIKDTKTGCVTNTDVFVATDKQFPIAEAGTGGTIDCNDPILSLSSIGSTRVTNIELEWSSNTGNILNDPTDEDVRVDAKGFYRLTLSNTENGCVSIDSVEVLDSFEQPQLSARDSAISCKSASVELTASSNTEGVSFLWTSNQLTNPVGNANLTVTDTGSYLITATAPNGCTSEKEVFVKEDRIFPTVEAGEATMVNCRDSIVTLDGTGTDEGSQFSYQWTSTNGHFLENSDLNSLFPKIDAGGIYYLEVSNNNNGCVSIDSVFADTSFRLPHIELEAPDIITCYEPVITIDASKSDSGAIYEFTWFESKGNFLSGTDTYRPVIDTSGDYILAITNMETGCANSQLLSIAFDQTAPVASAGEEQTLNCTQRIVILDGSGSSTGIEFSYQWDTDDGHFLNNPDSLLPEIDSAGTYRLTVTDTENGCESTASVKIAEDFAIPNLSIPADSTITCAIPSLLLSAISSTPGTSFSWTLPSRIVEEEANIQADQPGIYKAIITAPNGCTNTDSLEIFQEADFPVVQINKPQTLTCQNKEVTLSGEGSSEGAEFAYEWATRNGHFIDENQTDQLRPKVDSGGMYILKIENIKTGCTNADSVFVNTDTEIPEISLLSDMPDTFTCDRNAIELIATSNVPVPLYQWRLEENILSEEATLVVEQPGTFTVRVINPQNSCSKILSVTVPSDTITPVAEAGPNRELNCTIEQVQLDGSISSKGPEFTYLWTAQSAENIADTLMASVQKPGLYTLVVINKKTGCRALDTVRVTQSLEDPIADAGQDTLYCEGSEEIQFLLGGANTSTGTNIEYQWQNIKGDLLGNEAQLSVSIADTFLLQVTDTDNNCVVVDTVKVFEKPRPDLSLASSGEINCRDSEITFTAKSSSPAVDFRWEGDNDFVEKDSSLTLGEEYIGQEFAAIVTDRTTGCVGIEVIRVEANRLAPLLTAGEDTELNCADTLKLDGRILSENINATINWQTEDGNIVINENELNPVVDAAGTYILSIENTDNFCKASDTLIVSTNQSLPLVKLGEDRAITCLETEFVLGQDSVSEGFNIHYEWRDQSNKLLATTKELSVSLPDTYQLKVIDSTNLCTAFDKIIVFSNDNPPQITIETPKTITCINEQIRLNAIIKNIQEGSYLWTGPEGHIIEGGNTPTPLIDSGGVYKIQVINTLTGCEGERNIVISDTRKYPRITQGEDKAITCYNDSLVTLTGRILSENQEHFVHQWTYMDGNFTAVDTSLILNTNQSGSYFFTVEDTSNNCFVIDTVEVTDVISAVTFDIGADKDIDCKTSQIFIGNENAIKYDSLSYSWTTLDGEIVSGESDPLALVNQGGTYFLKITNTENGCSFLDSVIVFASTQLPTADAGTTKILTCEENKVQIGGENTAKGTDFIYEWTTDNGNIIEGQNTSFATVNAPGIYTLEVTNINTSCNQTASVTISEDKDFPDVTLPENLSFNCTNESININLNTTEDTQFLNINWFTMDGNSGILSETNQMTVEVGSPGKYFVRVGDSRNSCVIIDSISVADDRDLPLASAGEDRMLSCNNSLITLTAQGSSFGEQISYEWLNETNTTLSNSTTLEVNKEGTYFLKVTNKANQCVAFDTVLINNNINPPSNAIFEIAPPSCNGAKNGKIDILEVIGGTPPYKYLVSTIGEKNTGIFDNLEPDSYEVIITDELGCTWDTTIILPQPEAIEIQLESSDDELVTGEMVTITAHSNIPENQIAEIIWKPETLFSCFDCLEQTLSLTTNTLVEISIIDENGCIGEAALDITVSLAEIPNAITPNGDGLNDRFMFPTLEVNPTAYPDNELVIFNRWGDVVYRAAPYQNDWDGTTANGQTLPEGTYYWVLKLDVSEGSVSRGEVTILK